MTVTMKDIAQRAKVSVRTVSRALKQNGYVKGDKAREIRKLASEMNYTPDDLARGIKTGKTSVIGFVTSAPDTEHCAKIANNMSVSAEKYAYMIKLINGHHLGHDSAKYKEVADICIRHRLSALVVHGLSNDVILRKLKAILDDHDIELALISNASDSGDCLHVTSCDASGINQAVTYLHESGHRSFAFISPELRHAASAIRREAFLASTKKLQVHNPVTFAGDYSEIQFFLDKIFAGRNTRQCPTAIVCSGDNIATFTQSYLLKEHDVRTPEDVSVTGYGNFASGIECHPTLTTVYEPFAEMGTRIIEKLIAKLENRNFGELEEFIDTRLIVRGSTAPPAK